MLAPIRYTNFAARWHALLLVFALSACGDAPASATHTQPESAAQNKKHTDDSTPMPAPLEVKTYHGVVAGSWADAQQDIRAFRGVPYARPPVGELRWRPPQAPLSWTGVRPAIESAPACWQATHSENFVWARGDFARSEDCLYLNIWGHRNAEKQPVMVWFHGGAHTSGMGHEAIFDGSELARRGVVLVTLNYRLGALGFLAHPALAAESSHNSSGNYGLLDKLAALNWVRDNISQFGGDPNNITIFGQSAGSQSVCALMASPLAQGLFHKAIGQSAACVAPLAPKDANGYQRGQALADALGAKTPDSLRQVTPAALIEAANTSGWVSQSRITVDGWVLPEQPGNIYTAGRQANVPLLLGFMANEGHELLPMNADLSAEALRNYAVQVSNAAMADELLSLYSAQVKQSPGMAQREIMTDLIMAYGMHSWARAQQKLGAPVYHYYFAHTPPAFRLYWPENPDLHLPGGPRSAGAYHSGDLAYVFGNTHHVGLDWHQEDHNLSAIITQYWSNFAKTGDPNANGLPNWPLYDPEQQKTMVLEPQPQVSNGARRAQIALWDRYFQQ